MSEFSLQVVTPDGSCFDGQAVMVRLRTIEGDVAILAGHAPYVTAIGMGECCVQLPDGTRRRAACCGGLLSVGSSAVRLVATTFEWAERIDVPRAEAAAERARQKLAAGTEDPARLAALQDRLRRAEVRLQVAAAR